MRTALLIVVVLAVAGAVAWQNRVGLLVWGAPKVRQILNPIPENVTTNWARGPASAEGPPAERPPNIILILTDDMGFNDISLYNGGAGDGTLMTPNIDALAQAGVTFTNGYATNAVCAPSRASIMTGRYSTRFGFEFTPFPRIGATIFSWVEALEPGPLRTFVDLGKVDALPGETYLAQGMPPEEVTVAEVLKSAGYYTVHIGKWHLGGTPGLMPGDRGFDDSLNLGGLRYLPEDHPDVVNARR